MNYLGGYLFIGVMFLVAFAVAHLSGRSREPSLSQDIRDALHPERRTLRYKLIDVVVAPAAAGAFVILAWPALIPWLAWEYYKERHGPLAQSKKPFRARRRELTKKLTVEEVEALETIEDPLGAVPPVPFGFLNNGWKEFLESKKPGLEIWAFRSEGRGQLAGWAEVAGYASVRWGKVETQFISQLTSRHGVSD